jgi:hypothetical protein
LLGVFLSGIRERVLEVEVDTARAGTRTLLRSTLQLQCAASAVLSLNTVEPPARSRRYSRPAIAPSSGLFEAATQRSCRFQSSCCLGTTTAPTSFSSQIPARQLRHSSHLSALPPPTLLALRGGYPAAVSQPDVHHCIRISGQPHWLSTPHNHHVLATFDIIVREEHHCTQSHWKFRGFCPFGLSDCKVSRLCCALSSSELPPVTLKFLIIHSPSHAQPNILVMLTRSFHCSFVISTGMNHAQTHER